jgi:hypothetical protein
MDSLSVSSVVLSLPRLAALSARFFEDEDENEDEEGFALKNPCASVSIPPSLLASARQAVVKFPA